MFAATLRSGLIVLLVAGLLVPKSGAVLAQIVPGVMTMVICTGEKLVTITLNAAGEPIEIHEDEEAPCLRTDLAAPVEVPDRHWVRLALSFERSFAVKLNPRPEAALFHRKRPSQAPPVLI